MSVIGIILLTIGLVFFIAGIILVFHVLTGHSRYQRQREQASFNAALRTWTIAQQEQATDQAIRDLTHQAVARMMREARNANEQRW